jgi:hypothetical protein
MQKNSCSDLLETPPIISPELLDVIGLDVETS